PTPLLAEVAGESEILVRPAVAGARTSDLRPAGSHDLAVGLPGDREGRVVVAVEVGRHLAARAEGRIETPVRVVAGEGEVRVAGGLRLAGSDQLAVRLQHEREGRVVVPGEVGRHLAARAKGRIQTPVRVVAGEGEVLVAGGLRLTGHDDLPI